MHAHMDVAGRIITSNSEGLHTPSGFITKKIRPLAKFSMLSTRFSCFMHVANFA